jgi:hypothetical protein
MRISGGITIVLTLALISAFCSQAAGAPASELLQKGLYAEEVEGNIDSAIKIYGGGNKENRRASQPDCPGALPAGYVLSEGKRRAGGKDGA